MSRESDSFDVYGLVFMDEPDCRGPLITDDRPAPMDPVGEQFEKARFDQLRKDFEIDPDWLLEIGVPLEGDEEDDDPDAELADISKAARGPGRVRATTEVIRGDRFLVVRDHLGKVVENRLLD